MIKRMVDYWLIPPEQDAEFVANMEEVLETYAKPYNPNQPQVCMDEQPFQLLLETKVPLPATKEHGSWLNIAECELSAMSRQCFRNRRIGFLSELIREIQAWAASTNDQQ